MGEIIENNHFIYRIILDCHDLIWGLDKVSQRQWWWIPVHLLRKVLAALHRNDKAGNRHTKTTYLFTTILAKSQQYS